MDQTNQPTKTKQKRNKNETKTKQKRNKNKNETKTKQKRNKNETKTKQKQNKNETKTKIHIHKHLQTSHSIPRPSGSSLGSSLGKDTWNKTRRHSTTEQ